MRHSRECLSNYVNATAVAMSPAERFPTWNPVLSYLTVGELFQFAMSDFPQAIATLEYCDCISYREMRVRAQMGLLQPQER